MAFCAVFVYVSRSGSLLTPGFLAVERMDLQKLTRGIDHRGRICGWTPGGHVAD